MPNIKEIIFDIDGVLIESDGSIRREKYSALFNWGMSLINLPEYAGSTWMFRQLKDRYDMGIDIDPKLYQLIDKNTATTLKRLSERFKLHVCSVACERITRDKLKATGIERYFDKFYLKPFRLHDRAIAIVEDRFIDYGQCFFVKFRHGQYKDQVGNADLIITDLAELLCAI